MDRASHRRVRNIRRRRGLRKRLIGTPTRPRMSVFRSLKHLYVQVIDDLSGRTVVSASTRDKEFSGATTGNAAAAAEVGTLVAQRATKAGVTDVCFDRNGRQYHGRVKALAEAARKGGLKF